MAQSRLDERLTSIPLRKRVMVADLVESVVGPNPPVAFECYDGSRIGPDDPKATVELRSRDAVHRILTAPGDLGFGRAWVAGDLGIRGDIYAALALRNVVDKPTLSPRQIALAVRLLGRDGLKRSHRPLRRRGFTGVATDAIATLPPSRITTTCRTRSTDCSSDHRSRIPARCGRTARPTLSTHSRPSTS